MVKHDTERIPIRAAIVEVRFSEKAASIEIRTHRVPTAAGHAVTVKMIENDGQVGCIAWAPCEPAHDEFLVIAGIIILLIGILELAGQSIGKRVILCQIVAEIKADFLMIKRSAGDVKFA